MLGDTGDARAERVSEKQRIDLGQGRRRIDAD
jgi:hypothetical protein